MAAYVDLAFYHVLKQDVSSIKPPTDLGEAIKRSKEGLIIFSLRQVSLCPTYKVSGIKEFVYVFGPWELMPLANRSELPALRKVRYEYSYSKVL